MSRPHTPDPHIAAGLLTTEHKRYYASIERVLGSFETIESWPDNITFLTRLLKVIQAHPTISQIPKMIEVSGCLAHCVVSSLPSGVQQKALQIYAHIFSLLGREGLNRDISVWIPGLLPVLDHADLVLKTRYLEILSRFIIPLGAELQPFSKSLILAILPGLEDEHDEAFHLTMSLMAELRLALVDQAVFWSSFWLASISGHSSQRTGSLNYMNRHLPRAVLSTQVQQEIQLSECLSPDPGLLVRAFVAGLGEHEILVQRGFLDLLVINLPLSSNLVKQMPSSELQRLLGAAVRIVLRREVSLNRRLWSWLTGSTKEGVDDQAQSSEDYFMEYAQQTLILALSQGICNDLLATSKILLSLLDRDDVGGRIIRQLFPLFIQATHHSRRLSDFDDILVSARALFNATPATVIMANFALQCSEMNFNEALFVLDSFNFLDEEIATEHFPILLLAVLDTRNLNTSAVAFVTRLAHKIPQASFDRDVKSVDGTRNTITLEHLASAYASDAVLLTAQPKSSFGQAWLQTCLSRLKRTPEHAEDIFALLKIRSLHDKNDLTSSELILTFADQILSRGGKSLLPFVYLSGVADLICALQPGMLQSYAGCRNLSISLCEQCWQYLGTNRLRYEISSVTILSKLSAFLDMETFITLHVSQDLRSRKPMEKFSALWRHLNNDMRKVLLRRSALLVLDALTFVSESSHSYIVRWIRGSIDSAPLLLYNLFHELERVLSVVGRKDTSSIRQHTLDDDISDLSYYLKLLGSLLSNGGIDYIEHLKDVPVLKFLDDSSTLILGQTDCISASQDFATRALSLAPTAQQVERGANYQVMYRASIVVLQVLCSFDVFMEQLEPAFLKKVSFYVDQSHYELQHLFLRAMLEFLDSKKLESRRPSYSGMHNSMSHEHLMIVCDGLGYARGHPILQDWLQYLETRIDTSNDDNQSSILTIVQCMVDNISLNLIDIDAVLTTEPQSLTETTHENILLMLESLEKLGLSLLLDRPTPDADSDQQMQLPSSSSIFRSAFSFTAAPQTDTSVVPVPSNTAEVLRMILHLVVDIWIWSVSLDGHKLPSVAFVSALLKRHCYSIIHKIYTINSSEALDMLIAAWEQMTAERRLHLQDLCTELSIKDPPNLLNLLCRNVKTRITFSPTNIKATNTTNFRLTFLRAILKSAEIETCAGAYGELLALLRHLSLHAPISSTIDLDILDMISDISAKLLASSNGQQSKSKREISDLVVKLYSTLIVLDEPHTKGEHDTSNDSALCQLLAQNIIPRLPRIFLDLERISNALSIVMLNVVQPRLKSRTITDSVLDVLGSMSTLDGVRKTWKRDVQDYFSDSAFFQISCDIAPKWTPIFRAWLAQDKDKINEYLIKSNPTAPGNLFTSLESERVYRINQNRRLVFLLLVMPVDTFLPKLTAFREKFEELMKARSSTLLTTEALLLLRCILLRFSSVHLEILWPLVVTELQKAFARLLACKEPANESPMLLLSTIKTVDVLLFLSPASFQGMIWIFVSDISSVNNNIKSDALVDQLAKILPRDYEGEHFVPFSVMIEESSDISVGHYVRHLSVLNFERMYKEAGESVPRVRSTACVDASIWQELFIE